MASDPRVTRAYSQFLAGALRELGLAARRQARPRVPSATLRKAMEVVVTRTATVSAGRLSAGTPNAAFVRIPHYWAIYLHDGTDSLLRAPTLRGKSVYVFFARRRDDPRIRGGYPVRASQARSLTRQEYQNGLLENARRRARKQPPFMYVFKVLKASHPRPGARWFDNRQGMAGFPAEGASIILKRFDNLARSLLLNDKQTAKIRL